MSPEKIFEDYKTLKGMNAGRACKIDVLQTLVAQGTNNWRVVGITHSALQKFADQKFTYQTGSGIQRAHVFDRHDTFGSLIDTPVDEETFWQFIADRDRTILAIKGEYNTVSFDNMISLLDQGLFPKQGETVLFKARTIGYKFGSAEADALRQLM